MAPDSSTSSGAATPAVILLRPDDNVAVACRSLAAGEVLDTERSSCVTTGPVNAGHKVAVEPVSEGDAIRKYGQIIGFASTPIQPGDHVHVHNCAAQEFERDYAFASAVPRPEPYDAVRTFQGYRRADGRAGTRNYLAIVSTVNCSASTSKYIVETLKERGVLENFPNVDGVIPLTHKTGCGMAYDHEDHHQLARTLAGFAKHPNVAGYLIVGLGCEIDQASFLIQSQQLVQIEGTPPGAKTPPPVLTIQEAGGIAKTVEAGVRAISELLPKANAVEREEIPASKLVLGTECGGSDGNSGITANPALGVAADLLVRQGGTAILAEMPEIYGAEHLLTRRAVSREVGEALVDRIRWWEDYTRRFGAEINNNPTPGNKDGGLTTIYEKSLGAVAKGGSTALTAVYRYAETVTEPGFVVMDTPGYDPVSITGMVAGGANVTCFTTGRGSVFGCKPTPCVKIATNTSLYERMEGDMDINAGSILQGASVEDVGRQIFEEILAVASGKPTKSEQQGVGEEEFAPWNIGPTL